MKSIDALVLVCKDCRRRKNGPARKSRLLATNLKGLLKHVQPRPRIVRTTCLGACPTDATAVAVVAPGAGVRLLTIAKIIDQSAVLEAFAAP